VNPQANRVRACCIQIFQNARNSRNVFSGPLDPEFFEINPCNNDDSRCSLRGLKSLSGDIRRDFKISKLTPHSSTEF